MPNFQFPLISTAVSFKKLNPNHSLVTARFFQGVQVTYFWTLLLFINAYDDILQNFSGLHQIFFVHLVTGISNSILSVKDEWSGKDSKAITRWDVPSKANSAFAARKQSTANPNPRCASSRSASFEDKWKHSLFQFLILLLLWYCNIVIQLYSLLI